MCKICLHVFSKFLKWSNWPGCNERIGFSSCGLENLDRSSKPMLDRK
jgi:hypothetical protein